MRRRPARTQAISGAVRRGGRAPVDPASPFVRRRRGGASPSRSLYTADRPRIRRGRRPRRPAVSHQAPFFAPSRSGRSRTARFPSRENVRRAIRESPLRRKRTFSPPRYPRNNRRVPGRGKPLPYDVDARRRKSVNRLRVPHRAAGGVGPYGGTKVSAQPEPRCAAGCGMRTNLQKQHGLRVCPEAVLHHICLLANTAANAQNMPRMRRFRPERLYSAVKRYSAYLKKCSPACSVVEGKSGRLGLLG